MNSLKNSKRKGATGAQTQTTAENSFAQPQTKQPIGFVQKESRAVQEEPKAEMFQLAISPSNVFGLPTSSANQLTDMLVSVASTYFERRSNNCYREGLEKELLDKMNRIFIKYFDDIV